MARMKRSDAVARAVGRQIAAARHRAGMTQQMASEATGMTRTLIAVYETGMATPSLTALYHIADSLNVSVHDLLPSTIEPVAAEITVAGRPIQLTKSELDELRALLDKPLEREG